MNKLNSVEVWRHQIAISHARIRAESRRAVLAELLRHDSLHTDAAEVLADRWSFMFDNASSDVIADYISRHLNDEEVVRLSSELEPPHDTSR